MLQASNIGSSNEVVFTMKLADHPGNAGVLQRIKAETAKAQNEMWGVGRGTSGGGSSGGIPRSGPSAADTIAMNQRLQKQSIAQMVRDHNNAQKEMRKSVIENIKASREAREGADRAEHEAGRAQWQQRLQRMKAVAEQEVNAQAMLRGEIEKTSTVQRMAHERAFEGARMLASGVVNVARSFVLLGVSGEENMEKAVRAFAKFEAVVQAGTGLMNIAQGGYRLAGAAGFGGAGAAGMAKLGLATGGLAAVVGGGLYAFDQFGGPADERRRTAEWGRTMTYMDFADGATGGASAGRDMFSRRMGYSTRNRIDAGNAPLRSQLEDSGYRLDALRDMRGEAYQGLNSAVGRNGGEEDAARFAEQRLIAERAIEDTYRQRYDIVSRMRDVERDMGERSLEVARRVTQEFENRAHLAQRKRDEAVQNRDDAEYRYANASARDRASVQMIAGKIQRGEDLNAKERMIAEQWGFREDARASARRQNERENVRGTAFGQVLGGRADAAEAAAKAASDLAEASRKVMEVQRQELEKRLTALYEKQLKDIADAVIRSQENQQDFAETLKERQAQAVRRGAAPPP